jgi:hypothetical protein
MAGSARWGDAMTAGSALAFWICALAAAWSSVSLARAKHAAAASLRLAFTFLAISGLLWWMGRSDLAAGALVVGLPHAALLHYAASSLAVASASTAHSPAVDWRGPGLADRVR